MTYEEIRQQAEKACEELIETAKLAEGDILVVGCSSSEVMGLRIGKGSDINAAEAVYEGIMSVIRPRGIFLAAQCCEPLNRAVIVEKAALPEKTEIVNVVPQPKAGGSFATTMYHRAEKPVAVESIRADGHRRHSYRDAAQERGGSSQSFSEIYRGGSSGMRQNQT